MRPIILFVAFTFASGCNGDVGFQRVAISTTTFEAASVFDVDNDGYVDIVSGENWFPGPGFTEQIKMCDIMPVEDYFDDFADYPMDVNGDGYLDIISGAWFGQRLTWRENPQGQPVEWTVHEIAVVGNVERPNFWDIDGDGFVDIAPNTPGNPQRILRLDRDGKGDPLGTFSIHTISPQVTGHGLGFGDINGDGRGDLVVREGWFEGPEQPFAQEWTFHAEPNLFASASVPILVYDVNGDGLNDIIVGAGHDYGLDWWEQGAGLTWTRHKIVTDRSQFHEMALADLNGDGTPELITGKRWRAHPSGDPGGDDPVGLYYFDINGGEFAMHTLDFGPGDSVAGTGIYLWVADVDKSGTLDIVAPGKGGLYLFRNYGL